MGVESKLVKLVSVCTFVWRCLYYLKLKKKTTNQASIEFPDRKEIEYVLAGCSVT